MPPRRRIISRRQRVFQRPQSSAHPLHTHPAKKLQVSRRHGPRNAERRLVPDACTRKLVTIEAWKEVREGHAQDWSELVGENAPLQQRQILGYSRVQVVQLPNRLQRLYPCREPVAGRILLWDCTSVSRHLKMIWLAAQVMQHSSETSSSLSPLRTDLRRRGTHAALEEAQHSTMPACPLQHPPLRVGLDLLHHLKQIMRHTWVPCTPPIVAAPAMLHGALGAARRAYP